MASYRSAGVTWRARRCAGRGNESATFTHKAQAVAWAGRVEAAIDAGTYGDKSIGATSETCSKRYAKEISSGKDGGRWEKIRNPVAHRRISGAFPPVPA